MSGPVQAILVELLKDPLLSDVVDNEALACGQILPSLKKVETLIALEEGKAIELWVDRGPGLPRLGKRTRNATAASSLPTPFRHCCESERSCA
jgi:hypothetical protein